MFSMPRVGPCGGPLPTGEVLFMRPDGTHVDSLWFKLERAARRGIVTARRGRGGRSVACQTTGTTDYWGTSTDKLIERGVGESLEREGEIVSEEGNRTKGVAEKSEGEEDMGHRGIKGVKMDTGVKTPPVIREVKWRENSTSCSLVIDIIIQKSGT